MDYLIVAISSVLFPYILGLSGLDYKADIGIKASYQDFNKYSVSLLEGEDNSKRYVSKTSLLNYRADSIKPDVFLEYAFSNPKSRFFMAADFGMDTFDSGIQITTRRKETNDGAQTEEFHYIKQPYVSLKVGYSIMKNNPELNGYGAFGFTPYFIGGIMPLSYQDGSNYHSSTVTKYTPYWGFGSKINVKGPWSFYVEYRNIKVDGRGTQLKYQSSVTEQVFQFGFSYLLTSSREKAKLNAQQNYYKIIAEINKNNGANAGAQHQVFSSDSEKLHSGSTNKNAETNSLINGFSNDLTKNSKLIKQTTDKKAEALYNLDTEE